MATLDPSNGTIVSQVWDVSPAATAGDMTDEISANLAQLHAMATLICGEGFISFSSLNDKLQAEFLWAMSEKIIQTKAVFNALSRKL